MTLKQIKLNVSKFLVPEI